MTQNYWNTKKISSYNKFGYSNTILFPYSLTELWTVNMYDFHKVENFIKSYTYCKLGKIVLFILITERNLPDQKSCELQIS